MSELIQFTKGMVDAQDALNSNFNTLNNMISGGSEMATKQELLDFKEEVKNDIKKVSKPTTLVIGTSTSGHTSCDVLCDGVEDDVEINQAIQSIAIGGKITILEGIYNITNKISIDKPNITIEGMGKATQLKRMFNTVGGSSTSSVYGGVIYLSANNITIDGLFLDGNSTSYTGETGNYNVNIYGNGSTNTTIKNCNISNSYHGIRILADSKSIIENNIIENNTVGIYANTLNDSNILNNKLLNNSINHMCIYSSNNLNIYNNLFYNSGTNGIYCYSLTSSTIQENIIDKVTGDGNIALFLSYCDNNIFSNNKMSNATKGGGIYATNSSNNTFNGNNINETQSYGIRILTDSTNNTFNGNSLYNTRGLSLGDGATWNSVSSNNIKRGTGMSYDYTVDGTTQYSIYIMSGATKNLVIGNMMMGKNYTNSGGSTNTFANNKY